MAPHLILILVIPIHKKIPLAEAASIISFFLHIGRWSDGGESNTIAPPAQSTYGENVTMI